jgi:hypothetical protein
VLLASVSKIQTMQSEVTMTSKNMSGRGYGRERKKKRKAKNRLKKNLC